MSGTGKSTDIDFEALLQELDRLRRRGVERIDDRDKPRLVLPELEKLVARLPDPYATRSEALRALLGVAMGYVHESHERPIEILFGVVDEARSILPDRLYEEAARAHGPRFVSEKSVQRWVKGLRQTLANALVEAADGGFGQPVPARRFARSAPRWLPSRSRLPPPPEPLIASAQAIRDTVGWLRDVQGASQGVCVQLSGVSGVGKSVAALSSARIMAPDDQIALIRPRQRGLFEHDVRRALELEGLDTSEWSHNECLTALGNRAPEFTRLQVLIADDVPTADDLIGLLPGAASVPVIVTSQTRLVLGDPWTRIDTISAEGLADHQSRVLLGEALTRLPEGLATSL